MRFLFLLLVAFNVFAAGEPNEDLYVRPITGEYGLETGLSYAAAFDGKAAVTFSGTPGTVGSVDAGDTLHVCGAFVNEARLNINQSGSAGNVITIDGDCSADGDLSQSTWTGSSSGTEPGIRALDSTYITIKNLSITRTGGAGIQFDSTGPAYNTDRNVTFSNVSVSWAGYGQAQAAGKNNFTLHGNIYSLTNVYSGFAMDDNLWIMGNTITITGAYSEGSNFNDLVGYGDGIQCGGAGTGANCTNLIIRSSTFIETSHYKQAINVTSYDGERGSPTGPVLIENTSAYCPINPANGGSGCVTLWGLTNAVFRYNYVYGGTGVSMLDTSSNSQFYSNIITGGPSFYQAVSVANGLSIQGTGHIVYNNSISNVFRGISANTSGTLVRNNIVSYTNDFGIFAGGGGGGAVEAYNTCYQCALTGNSAFPNGAGTNSVTTDPKFSGGQTPTQPQDFRLAASSPAIRSGFDVGRYQDYGNRAYFIGSPSRGAWEQASGSQRVTATARSTVTPRTTVTARTTVNAR